MGCRETLRALARVLDTLVGGKILVWRQGETTKLYAETHSLQLRGETNKCIEVRDNLYYLIDTSQLRAALRNAPKNTKIIAENGEARLDGKTVGTRGAKPRIRDIGTRYTGYAAVEPKGFRELVETLDTDSVILGYTIADTFAIGVLWLHNPRLSSQGPYLWDHVALVNGLVNPVERGSAKLTVISKYYAVALGLMEELYLYPPDDMLYPLKVLGTVGGARLEAYIAPAAMSDEEKKQVYELYARGALTDHVTTPGQLILPGSWAARLAEAITPMTMLYLRPGEQLLVQPIMGDTVAVTNLAEFKALLIGAPENEAYELYPPEHQVARLARFMRTVSLKLGRAAFFWDEEIGAPIDPANPEGLLGVAEKALANASAGDPAPSAILSRDSIRTIVMESRYAPMGAEVVLEPLGDEKKMCYAKVYAEDTTGKVKVAEAPLVTSICRKRVRTRLHVLRLAALLDNSAKVYIHNGIAVIKISKDSYAVTRQ